jgi:gluconolactonase
MKDDTQTLAFSPEPGITLVATIESASGKGPLVVLLNLDGAETARKGDTYAVLKKSGARVATLDLRGTGKLAVGNEQIGRAPDHHSAEWGLWLGRPLAAQWVTDVIQFERAMRVPKGDDVVVIGEGPAGVVAIFVAAVAGGFSDQFPSRITKVAAVNSLASFVTDVPYTNQRLGLVVPGIIREFGDIAPIASFCSPRRVVIAGGVSSSGNALTPAELAKVYEPALSGYKFIGQEKNFVLTTPENVLKELGLIPAKEDKKDKEKDEPIFEPGAKLVTLAGGGAAGEGPAWDPKLGVLTSGSKGIHQLTPEGEKKVWREKAGTNGLLFDRNGDLVCCEPESRSVSRITRDGKRTVLTASYDGKKYNQPNDLTIDSKNRIYFSDPRYGGREDMQQRDEKGNTIEGVYRIDPDGKVTRVIGREVDRANGVLVSADDKYLFVADNNNDKVGTARKLWRFDLKPDGTVDPKSQKLLYDWGKGRGPDGVKQDSKGRLYVAGGLNKPNAAEPATDVKGGIYVIDPDSGKLLAFVGVPTDEVTNCAFGGDDLKTLYITGGGTLYSIKTTTPGRVIWPLRK